jgi:two-component system, NtrC family, response regulator AtoC
LSDPIKPHRILVVDDEYLMRWSLSQALTKQGHQVLSAENGKEAIEILKAQTFDFIIPDLLMPESDGWKVLEVSRKSRPRPRVIIISSHGVESTEEMAKVKGAWAYVEKPYVFDKINDLLK